MNTSNLKAARPLGRPAVLAVAALATLLSLAGCFGGSDDETTTPDPLAAVPDSATATTDGLVAYQQALATVTATTTDSREPIDVSDTVLPTSDTTEPLAVD